MILTPSALGRVDKERLQDSQDPFYRSLPTMRNSVLHSNLFQPFWFLTVRNYYRSGQRSLVVLTCKVLYEALRMIHTYVRNKVFKMELPRSGRRCTAVLDAVYRRCTAVVPPLYRRS